MTHTPAESVIDLYRRHGAAWAALRSDLPAEGEWIDRFCALLPAAAEVLDIGCGSGLPIARGLIRRGFAVIGTDAAPEMLALFGANLPGTPAALADMRTLALNRTFAGLIAWDSLFHLSPADQRRALDRILTHAAPGAALLFTSGPAEGSAIGTLVGEPLYHGSLGPAEYRARLAHAGFAVVDHRVEDPLCGRHTVWLACRSC